VRFLGREAITGVLVGLFLDGSCAQCRLGYSHNWYVRTEIDPQAPNYSTFSFDAFRSAPAKRRLTA